MYLKRLDIKGFKSFAEDTEINLQPGINIVVGPNGCGKSNVVDAIRWVLGEGNVRTLRGQKGEDVIFSGTDNKRAVGMATVEITVDNSDHFLPLDFNEITLGRKIFRSGESEFLLNKSKVRMKDISNLFTGTGLGRSGYSIISQGELEHVLNGQGMDRRLMLEEASGVIKYRRQRDEVVRRLEHTKNNLLRLGDIINELKERKDELYHKAEKAKLYNKLSEELLQTEKAVLGYELSRLEAELKSRRESMKQKQMEIKEARERLVEKQKLLESEEQKLEQIRIGMGQLREEKYTAESLAASLQAEIKLSEERIKTNRERIQSADNDAQKYQKMLESISGDIEAYLLDCREQQENSLLMEREYEKLNRETGELEKEIHDLLELFEYKKAEVFERTQEESQVKNAILIKEEEIQRNEDKKARLGIHIEELKEKIKIQKSSFSKLENEEKQLLSERDELQKAEEEVAGEKSKLLNALQEVEKELGLLQEQKLQLKNTMLSIEDMQKNLLGYSPGVKAVLALARKGRLTGIVGIVGELLDVPEGLEVAIETAGGRGLENMVVNTSRDARDAIQLLKEKKAGRVTFLPLDTLRVSRVPREIIKEMSNEEGVLGLAADLVKYPSQYAAVIDYILGRSIITENINTAIRVFKRVKYPFKIITLDGELINASGAMTGGSRNQNTVNPLQRKAQLKVAEQNYRSVEKRITRLLATMEAMKEEIKKADSRLAVKRENMLENNVRLEISREQLQNLKADIDNSASQSHSFMMQRGQLEKGIEILSGELQELKGRKQSLQKDSDQVADGLEELKESIEEKKRDYELKCQRLISYGEQLDMKKRELENTSRNIEQFKQVRSSYEASGTQACRLKDRLEAENNRENARIGQLKEETQQKLRYLTSLNEQSQQMREIEAGSIETCHILREEVLPMNEIINRLENALRNSEVSIARVETEYLGMLNNWQEKFSAAEHEPQPRLSAAKVREYKENIELLRRQLEDVGSVDIDSIQEHQNVEERFRFINGQYEDLMEARQSLSSLLKETEKIMARDFSHFLLMANESFMRTFTEIFNGGEARLKVEQDKEQHEAGVDIEVKIPGKKVQSLNLLSGGERALTCIAFIFALLRLKPVPFCLLDEVDASLDETNLLRFSGFLQAMSQDTQFIVITHRQATIEAGQNIYGITMQEKGVSRVLTLSVLNQGSMAG